MEFPASTTEAGKDGKLYVEGCDEMKSKMTKPQAREWKPSLLVKFGYPYDGFCYSLSLPSDPKQSCVRKD